MAPVIVITREWVFTTAQTNVALLTAGATEKIMAVYAKATCANSNTGDVSIRVGFAAATLPATSDTTGVSGVFMSHGGIGPGGGEVSSMGGAILAIGELGEDLRITCSEATGGSLRLVVAYRLLVDQ